MSNLVSAPIWIPLLCAAAGLFAWSHPRIQVALCVGGAALQLVVALALFLAVHGAGPISLHAGGWMPPFGIGLCADGLSTIMVLVGSLVALATTCFSVRAIDRVRTGFGYFPLVAALLAGVNLAFLTADLFNLYVAFEVMLIASFVLIALGGGRDQLIGALKYVTLNLFASALFLAGVGLVYGITGTLDLESIAARLPLEGRQGLVLASAALLLVAFGIKAAVFPLFFWLPAAYPHPPPVLTALFSGLLTKVGVYAMIRVFTGAFAAYAVALQPALLWVAGLTMVVGVLGAAVQSDFRRILSFHIVSQIGYSLMGLALLAPLGIAGAIFFLVHNIVAKSNLFLVCHAAYMLQRSYAIREMGGFYRERGLLAALFLVPAFSLAGIPPLSGFVAKLALVEAGLEQARYLLVAAALGTSLMTLFSMTKIWSQVFFKRRPLELGPAVTVRQLSGWQLVPIAALALVTVWLGVHPQPLFSASERAAALLLGGGGGASASREVRP